jgi:hypothetical protein
MRTVNEGMGRLVAAILWPFQSWPAVVGLAVVSLLGAMAWLVAFRFTSNQRAIAGVKRRIQAGVFELRLFQDDPRVMLRVAAELLRAQASYLRYALAPLLWVSLPLSLLIAQLQTYYGYEPLRPGRSVVVTARLRTTAIAGANVSASDPHLALEVGPGVRVETPSVWVPSLRETSWRIAADCDGDYELRVMLNGQRRDGHDRAGASKRLRVTSEIVALSPLRPSAGIVTEWEHPAEPPLPADGPIESIAVSYPEAEPPILSLPWLALFFILTTAFALAGRPLLGVVW